MSTKEEILHYVARVAAQGVVSENEVVAAYRSGSSQASTAAMRTTPEKRLGVAEILYYIGGAIVFIGIAVLIYQNWISFNPVARILASLGSSIAAFVAAVLFSRYEKLGDVAQAFYLISALVAPIGLAVTFHEAGMDVGSHGVQSLIAVILLVAYLTSFIVFRKVIFTVFSIIFGTWLFFSLTSLLAGGRPLLAEIEFYEYRFLFVGLSYILLGYTFAKQKIETLAGWLYSFGVVSFLGAALALGGWHPRHSIFWEVVFPGLCFGVIFLSIYLKSRAFLIFGSIFLMAYILKITGEYFTDTLGWPFALVLAGLALIGIGFGTFYVNKRYLAKKSISVATPS